MKLLKFLLGGAGLLALLTLSACNDEPDESEFAKHASISSDDSSFVADATGGAVTFTIFGGQVLFNVACGTDWEAVNDGTDWLEANVSVSAGTLTLVAGQNTDAKENSATVILQTSASGVRFATINVTQTSYDAPAIIVESTEWHAPSVGTLTTTIAVEASGEWEVAEVSEDWLTAEKTDDGLQLTAEENTDNEERTATATVSCTDGVTTASATDSVTQDGLAYITLNPESLSFDVDGGSAAVTVDSDFDWEASCEESWITLSQNGSKLTVTAAENGTYDEREAVVSITAGDGALNTAAVELAVSQAALQEATDMILLITTTGTNKAVKIPLSSTDDIELNCTVDWGDGSDPETVTTTQPSHTYANAGDYEVVISGTVPALRSSSTATGNSSVSGIYTYLTGVKQWGMTGLKSLNRAFLGCIRLTSLPEAGTTGHSLEDVTDFTNAFYNCSTMVSIPYDMLAKSDAVTTFASAFYQCKALTDIPEGFFDGCTAVTSFEKCFYNCQALTSIPAGLLDKCSASLTSVSYMFFGCSALETIPSGLLDNCTQVTDFSYLFDACSALKEIPSGLFAKCAAAENLGYIFYNCTGIESVPSGLFDGCANATTFQHAFRGCTALKSIPDGLFDKCLNVENFTYLFYQCAALEKIPTGLFDKCTGATNFSYVFNGCESLTEIPANLFSNNTKATTFGYCFTGCTGLTSVPAAMFKGMTEVTTFISVFSGCTSLATVGSEVFSGCTAVTTMSTAFSSCTALETVPADVFKGLTKVTLCSSLFNGSGIVSLPEGIFDDFTAATTFTQTFYNCTSLKSLPTSLLDHCLEAKTFTNAFCGCTEWEGESPYTEITDDAGETVKVHIYERADYPDNFPTAPTKVNTCFKNCTKLTDHAAIYAAGWCNCAPE